MAFTVRILHAFLRSFLKLPGDEMYPDFACEVETSGAWGHTGGPKSHTHTSRWPAPCFLLLGSQFITRCLLPPHPHLHTPVLLNAAEDSRVIS